jgi:hypothetical protein
LLLLSKEQSRAIYQTKKHLQVRLQMPDSHGTLRGDAEQSGSEDASIESAEKLPSCKDPLKS